MPTTRDLEPLVSEPREDLAIEYKRWLDLNSNKHRAVLAKACIALVNHGGGFLVLGFEETESGLESRQRPDEIPEITQDAVNNAIGRFAEPEFHAKVTTVEHPETGIRHPIIILPDTLPVPVMSRRDCEGIIKQNCCYIRKPGPRSDVPTNSGDWRGLLDRCARANTDELLESFRAIMSGRTEAPAQRGTVDKLREFCRAAHSRLNELAADEAPDSPARFPHGAYEVAFSLIGAQPAEGLTELQDQLLAARRIQYTGWPPFMEPPRTDLASYAHEDFVEVWLGRRVPDHVPDEPHHCDFWRASPDGRLYTIRGYVEDALAQYEPGTVFDVALPVWRVGEAVLHTLRLAETFPGTDAIAIWCRYTGLNGRALVSVNGNRLIFGDDVCRTDEITLETQTSLDRIRDNLPEVLHGLLKPLYERFNFFRLPMQLVEEELDRMTGGGI